MARIYTRRVKTGGINVMGVVFLILLMLKLTGTGMVATWSWWWVTCPIWIGPAAVIGVFICFAIIAAIFGFVLERS
jgi:hypothetical protein